jgi:hypothetical protein
MPRRTKTAQRQLDDIEINTRKIVVKCEQVVKINM